MVTHEQTSPVRPDPAHMRRILAEREETRESHASIDFVLPLESLAEKDEQPGTLLHRVGQLEKMVLGPCYAKRQAATEILPFPDLRSCSRM